MPSSRASWWVHALGLAVILWVLYPVYFHAQVWVPAPSADVVRALRSEPGAERLAELARQRPLGRKPPEGAESVELADRWLAAARSGAPHPLRMQLSAEDFARDNGMPALSFASLYGADVFVAAYGASGRQEYLDIARQLILAFARFERSAWRDPGMLWNDHAVAARVGVVLRFWHLWRTQPSFAEGDAAEILQQVARSAALLAKPSHFTAFSNHGVMQNLALLQAAAAFPGLVDARAMSRIAYERLELQLGYYISPEGVVLEHSAGYHAEGVFLLRLATELLRINGMAAPAAWGDSIVRATEYLDRITRPDGTLPAYGDTYVGVPAPVDRRPTAAPATTRVSTWPLSGYALIESRDTAGAATSHAVLTSSYFRGHGHKHADEPGFVLWADGRGWITPSGYAPYLSAQRTAIEAWLGSNAPHGLGETPDPARAARLLGTASAADWALLDAERVDHDGAGFRRQILQATPCHWIVVDHPLGMPRRSSTETVWTFLPDLTLEPLSPQAYRLRAPGGQAMRVRLVGGDVLQTTMHHGSDHPAIGWVAAQQGFGPSAALRVLSNAAGWSAAVFTLDGCSDDPVVRADAPDQWEAATPTWRLRRDRQSLTFARPGHAEVVVAMTPAPDVTAQRAALQHALDKALDAYPKHRILDPYRLRMAAWLCALWGALLVVTLATRRWLAPHRGMAFAVHGGIAVCWIGVALWLRWSYFAG